MKLPWNYFGGYVNYTFCFIVKSYTVDNKNIKMSWCIYYYNSWFIKQNSLLLILILLQMPRVLMTTCILMTIL